MKVMLAAFGAAVCFSQSTAQNGNQNLLLMVSERRYSRDLEARVLAKCSDRCLGTSSYPLTTVAQTEPPPSLFQIPAGYTVKEDGQ
jgi:hypothetical protein